MTDYLDNDEPINGQKYVCLSILTNKSIKDLSSGEIVKSDNNARGIKIRGVYNTMEEAKKRCEQIRQFDKLISWLRMGKNCSLYPINHCLTAISSLILPPPRICQVFSVFY